MSRISVKITGGSGQGINSIGEIVAKGLKRSGYCVFGYREYPSLIKGGHAGYQIDIDSTEISSTQEHVDVLISLNYGGLKYNMQDLKKDGVVVHRTMNWKMSEENQKIIDDNNLHVKYIPLEEILKKLKAKPILGNVILTSYVWAILGQDIKMLKDLVSKHFAHKKDLLELNMICIDEGYALGKEVAKTRSISLSKPDKKWKEHMLITGSEAMGLGAIHAGVRMYAGYPMTPSSPLLAYIANMQNKTGMIVKQAEDEITAAQIISGAMYAGTRALTATSGGGFDLMSETISMNGIIENPAVFVLAQRQGPSTGLPTWTGQGDLFVGLYGAHGEFPRCVLSVSDSQDSFDLMPEAFNIAEEFQINVIVLTDKQIAEALYTQAPYDQRKAKMKRGKLITDQKELDKLKGTDRYDPQAQDGVSLRWLPGSKADTHCAQGDEHNADGTVDESAVNAIEQMDKRMKKAEALKNYLPDPELYGKESPELLLVGWGSTKESVLDALRSEGLKDKSIAYLHFTYLWPLKTEKFDQLKKTAKRTVLIEANKQGQLGRLIKQESGSSMNDAILKYDGRPFFYDELIHEISSQLKNF